jgi:thiosulfate reductase cytochrome b subunit
MSSNLAQPIWVRVSDWRNAMAVALLILAGWRIYDASPVFAGLTLPASFKIADICIGPNITPLRRRAAVLY